MDRKQSLVLFEACESARQKALQAGASYDEAHEAAKAVWNGWAETLLVEQQAMENRGEWDATLEFETSGRLVGNNDSTASWFERADLDFSGLSFQSTDEGDPQADGAVACYGGLACFDEFVFPGNVSFESASFRGKASFEGSVFVGSAQFDAAELAGNFSLSGATFNSFSEFSGFAVAGDADFGKAVFSGYTSFRETSFSGYAGFMNVSFAEKVSFMQAAFTGDAYFDDCLFRGDAVFERARFSSVCSFGGARFSKVTDFGSAQLLGVVYFTSASFEGDAYFGSSTFEKDTYFQSAVFHAKANFSAVHGERIFDLANVNFKMTPDFAQADFNKAPRLDNIEISMIGFWESVFTRPDPEDVSRFRALRGLAIDAHDHERERLFFKGEMRSKRGNEEKWWRVWKAGWWFSVVYDAISDYGQAVIRPIAIWLVLIPVFGWIYLGYANAVKVCADSLVKANYLAAQNALLFLASGRSTEIRDAYGCLFQANNIPAWLGIIGLSQTLLSAVLLFFILLGIRNMFKIK